MTHVQSLCMLLMLTTFTDSFHDVMCMVGLGTRTGMARGQHSHMFLRCLLGLELIPIIYYYGMNDDRLCSPVFGYNIIITGFW